MQVSGYKGAEHKRFGNRDEAEAFMHAGQADAAGSSTTRRPGSDAASTHQDVVRLPELSAESLYTLVG